MAIFFGIAAALGWGIADVLYRFSGRSVGALRAMFYFQVLGLALMSIALVARHDAVAATIRSAPASAWLPAIVAAGLLVCASMTFVRALTVGTLALIAPVMASYGAVTAVLTLLHGDPIAPLALLGLGLAVVGVALASAATTLPQAHAGRRGLGRALLSALLFGLGFWVQGTYAVPQLGTVIPVWCYYATGTVALGLIARGTGRSLAPPAPNQWGFVYGAGLLGTFGYFTFGAGVATGHVAIVTVLSSLGAAVTVVIARFVLSERLAIHQWVGVGAIILGIVLINSGA